MVAIVTFGQCLFGNSPTAETLDAIPRWQSKIDAAKENLANLEDHDKTRYGRRWSYKICSASATNRKHAKLDERKLMPRLRP
jgi:hypothetical protein